MSILGVPTPSLPPPRPRYEPPEPEPLNMAKDIHTIKGILMFWMVYAPLFVAILGFLYLILMAVAQQGR
jgi:hypothetical protein